MAVRTQTLCNLAILGILSLWTGCATMDGKPLVALRIPPSSGDGNFRDISWRFPWPSLPVGLPVTGYVVKFPAFDLGEEYHAEFAVKDLHDIDKRVWVYLLVDVGRFSDDETQQLQATFEFEVLDGKGQTVAHAKNRLGELTWSTPLGVSDSSPDSSGLYSFKESFFQVHKGENYTLRVQYHPDPALRSRRGFVYLQSGGSI